TQFIYSPYVNEENEELVHAKINLVKP
ncbi:MAG: hypothetical protein ACJAZH_001654, partial [Roseivirga sp.]